MPAPRPSPEQARLRIVVLGLLVLLVAVATYRVIVGGSGEGEHTYAVSPPGDQRIFVTERFGTIRVVENGTVATFVDLTDRVRAGGIEQGLLGLAFHPEFASNGRFFVYYTNTDGHRTLSELATDPGDRGRGDPDSERIDFSLPQPPRSTDIRHYGGMLAFGPDGYL